MPLARPFTTRTSEPALLASFCSRRWTPCSHLDRALVETAPAFENGLLTALFLLLSAWWVKGPLLWASASAPTSGAAGCHWPSRRRAPPPAPPRS